LGYVARHICKTYCYGNRGNSTNRLQLVYRLNRSHLSVQRSRYDDHRHIKKGEPNRRRMENAMYSIQPTQLTDEEFFRTCLQILVMGELPKNYQEELLKRYEKALDKLAEPAQ
jgi:hypothetical protein